LCNSSDILSLCETEIDCPRYGRKWLKPVRIKPFEAFQSSYNKSFTNIRANNASADRWRCAGFGAVLGSALCWVRRSGAVLLQPHGRTSEFWLVSRALLAMLCIFAMKLAVNIPINKKPMTWNAAAPPSDLSTVWAPWEQVHSIRALLAIIAFVAEVIALSR
jgi:hypothetical protein